MTALTKASVDIANQTKVLGIATLKDSNAMKNIAILTTIFLPGTYIAVSIWLLWERAKHDTDCRVVFI